MRKRLFSALVFIAIMLWGCSENAILKDDNPGIIYVNIQFNAIYFIDVENHICALKLGQGTASIDETRCAQLIKKYAKVENN